MRVDIDPHVTCMETFTMCDMYGDILHHVICMETLTAM